MGEPLPCQKIVLLIPGLCGPESDPPVSEYLQPRPAALDRLLSRSQPASYKGTGLDAALFRWFGVKGDQQDALPVAPLCFRSDAAQAADGYVLRADPVYLRADQSKLHLFEGDALPITQDEADELVSAFNSFYLERGWQLHAPCPQRWYLSLATPPVITTTPLSKLGGQDINAFLPCGDEAVSWRQTLNEVQMLFHDHPVNTVRAQRGDPVINSLWFWGGGFSPDKLYTRAARIVTNHPLGKGLALHTGISRFDVPGDGSELLSLIDDGVTLTIVDVLSGATQYGDIERWVNELRSLEEYWFVPLLESLRQGTLSSLEIDPCNGTSFITHKRLQRYFWKRSSPFERVCLQ